MSDGTAATRQRRFVSLVIWSTTRSGAELAQLLGTPDRPSKTRASGEAVWQIDGEASDASVDRQLVAFWDRVAPLVERLTGDDLGGLLRVVQYQPSGEFQGHGFVIEAGWISLLSQFGGCVDVDLYVE